MLKLKKKTAKADAAPPPPPPQGIRADGNILRRLWIGATAIILTVLMAGFGYLYLIREVNLQESQIKSLADGYALQQAAAVDQVLVQFNKRLSSAARSPLVLSAVSSKNVEDIALVEKTLLDYFPEATGLRLIVLGNLGTAGFSAQNQGLRNHIEVDLLRRTAEGSKTSPESYKFEQRWLTSLAVLVEHPKNSTDRALILLTFDNNIFSQAMAILNEDTGKSALQQTYSRGEYTKVNNIAGAGDGGGTSTYSAEVKLRFADWVIVYTPSEMLTSKLGIDSSSVVQIFALTLIVVLASLIGFLVMLEKQLISQVERVLKFAAIRPDLTLRIPALVDIAKQLRKGAQKASRSQPAPSKRQKKEEKSEEPLVDPLFQSDSMFDQDEEDHQETPSTEADSPLASVVEDIPAHIFRAYDIRGIAETELHNDAVYKIGLAIGSECKDREQQAVYVGYDGRKSSPRIKASLVKGLLDSGRDVIDLGLVTTPILYFATATLDTQSGVMVTGSHNAAEYNGLKITIAGNTICDTELSGLYQRIADGVFTEGAGKIIKKDLRGQYIEKIVSDMAIAVPLKIVVDAGNGVAGLYAPELLEELGCEVIPLYCDVDGDFPNHHPDPSDENNLADLRKVVDQQQADLGIAFDGDGDRLAVVTNSGQIVRADKLLMLFAQDIVSRNPGADVIFDVKCSHHLAQLVSSYGGRPIMWKSGHAYMKQKLKETSAQLAGEFSGHFFFGERWYGFDDGLYAAARLAEILSTTDCPLDDLLLEFPETVNTPEIRLAADDLTKFKTVDNIIQKGDFAPGKVNTLDGIRVDYEDGWGLVRASNTMPVLTLRFEANDADGLMRIQEQFRQQLAAHAPNISVDF